MKKTIVLLLAIVTVSSQAWAGIYRHDKDRSDYVSLAKEPHFDCVEQLYWKNEKVGSCVLISGRFLLTAAHCFKKNGTGVDTLHQANLTIYVNNPNGAFAAYAQHYCVYFRGKKYRSKAIHIYPEYIKDGTNPKCDIALIELEEPVADVIPATICRTFDELHANFVGVGFGVQGKANEPENVRPNDEKLAGENVIDSMCGYTLSGKKVSMLCDFDHATNKKCNRMGSSTPRPLEYLTGGGDSGGGAFRKTAAGWELIGICGGSDHGGIDVELLTTVGVGYYGQEMTWQRVSVFASWIQENEK